MSEPSGNGSPRDVPNSDATGAGGPREELFRLAGELQEAVAQGADEVRRWIASPAGQRFRKRAAAALIVSAPLVLRSRAFRATLLGRLVEVAGGAAIVVKLAEAIRDWEPAEPPEPIV